MLTFSPQSPDLVTWGVVTHGALGPLMLGFTSQTLCRLSFCRKPLTYQKVLKEWRAAWPHTEFREDQSKVSKLAKRCLRSSKKDDVPDILLTGTLFQHLVWAALLDIPAGQTVTYGELARRIGKPKAARAVGTALGANPVPLLVPCHRVVASTGLGGYTGGLSIKESLLKLEKQKR